MINGPADKCEQRDIGPHDAVAFPLPGTRCPEAVRKGKHDHRADREQDEGIAHDAVAGLFIPGRGDIFFNGHGVHIPHAAAVQVTGSRMMDGVGMFPLKVGSPDRGAEQQSKPVVCKRGLKNEP